MGRTNQQIRMHAPLEDEEYWDSIKDHIVDAQCTSSISTSDTASHPAPHAIGDLFAMAQEFTEHFIQEEIFSDEDENQDMQVLVAMLASDCADCEA
jgi:hypothetical protein